jgi:hypothetical protein
MKKPLQQYLAEQYGGSVSEMAHDWKIAESSIRRMLVATKPVHVYRDANGRLTIESELRVKK